MPEVNTNYNYPIPPENVYGQTIAGPTVANPQQTEQNTSQTQQTTPSEEGKGKYIDRYA